MTNKRYISYDNMHTMLNAMYRQMTIDGYKPDVVIGLARGGLVPAVHFSHYFDVPMISFQYSLRDHPGKDDFTKIAQLFQKNTKVLIVDDICDEGHTLYEVIELIKQEMPFAPNINLSNVKTAVLQHNLGATLFDPDYCGEEINKVEKPEWIVYPFEY